MNSHKHGPLCKRLHSKTDTWQSVLRQKRPWLEIAVRVLIYLVLEQQKITFICGSDTIPLFFSCDGLKGPYSPL